MVISLSCRVIANKSATTMLCCYAMGSQPFVYLQRGYRNYGQPNVKLFSLRHNSWLLCSQSLGLWITIFISNDDAIANARLAKIQYLTVAQIVSPIAEISTCSTWSCRQCRVKTSNSVIALVNFANQGLFLIRIALSIAWCFAREVSIGEIEIALFDQIRIIYIRCT